MKKQNSLNKNKGKKYFLFNMNKDCLKTRKENSHIQIGN